MRYAIISDIHSNLAAWNAVLLDIRSVGIDCVISLGDMVGYGPQPREVLESLHLNVDYCLLGNHDAAACGKIDAKHFNSPAKDIIQWTESQLGESAKNFLNQLPLSLAGENFRCSHANFSQPAGFRYIFDPADALSSWEKTTEPLLFIGHTHQPGMFILGQSGTPRWIPPEDFVLEEGKRFLLNVGSVGQPREGDYRSTYCVYDSTSRSVFWRKVLFDLDAHRKALLQADLPLSAAPFLEIDPASRPRLAREYIDFRPPAAPSESMQTTLPVQQVTKLKKRVRHWQWLSLGLGLLITIALATGTWFWQRAKERSLIIPAQNLTLVRGSNFAPGSNLLEFPDRSTAPNQPLTRWSIQLENQYRQTIHWENAGDAYGSFIFQSEDQDADCSLVSPEILMPHGTKLMMQAFFQKSEKFQGSIALIIELTKKVETSDLNPLEPEYETIRYFSVKEPNQKRSDGWWLAQQTFTLPARNVHSVRLRIGGKFKGEVAVSRVRLESPR